MQTCVQKILRKACGFKTDKMFIKAQEEAFATCRSKGPHGVLIERTYDYAIASRSFQVKIRKWKWRVDTTQGSLFFGRQRQRSPSMARTKNAETAARVQWWEVARKEQRRKRQRGMRKRWRRARKKKK